MRRRPALLLAPRHRSARAGGLRRRWSDHAPDSGAQPQPQPQCRPQCQPQRQRALDHGPDGHPAHGHPPDGDGRAAVGDGHLRGGTDPDGDADGHRDGHPDGDADRNADTHADRRAGRDGHADRDADAHRNAQCDPVGDDLVHCSGRGCARDDSDEQPTESTTWWPWLLLLLLLVAGLVWWLPRRREAQRVLDEWDARLAESRGEATWVEESLVTQVLAMPTSTEAAGVWAAARPRLLAIDESLLALEGSAPDEARRASAAALRDRLARLVEAVGADTGAAPDSTPDDFRARRAAIDTARRSCGPRSPPSPA